MRLQHEKVLYTIDPPMADFESLRQKWDGSGGFAGLIRSLNLHLYHLTGSQSAMIGARAWNWYEKNTRSPISVECGYSRGDGHQVREFIGNQVGSNGRSVSAARRVLRDAIPEVIKAVEDGRINVLAAEILSSWSADAQLCELSNPQSYHDLREARADLNRKAALIPKEKEDDKEIKLQGVGVMRAHEAINSLKQIPRNDALRNRAFQIVKDWIKHNQ